jgi:hypothetical protein
VPACLQVALPVGLIAANGAAAREIGLRPLTGADELLVQEAMAASAPRAATITELLGGCLAEPDETAAEDLCVGDREALLLHLRRTAFGERIEAMVDCPQCRERLDLELRTSDLLLPPGELARPRFAVSVEANGAGWRTVLRRVTGADQQAVLDAEDPATALLRRCVVELVRDDGVAWPVEDIPDELAGALDEVLRRSDPQAEIHLDLACPACGHGFTAPFDPTAQLFAELAAESSLLLREVAAIARAFHWRERDILALPRGRRQAYAALAAGR